MPCRQTASGSELVLVAQSMSMANLDHARLDKIFMRLCKDFKLSMKHPYNIYSDSEYYYFYDCFAGQPKNRRAIFTRSVKVKINEAS